MSVKVELQTWKTSRTSTVGRCDMATINCPGCNALLADRTIEAIASGSKVAGAGGVICPRCGMRLRHRDIDRLLRDSIPLMPPPEMLASLAGLGIAHLVWWIQRFTKRVLLGIATLLGRLSRFKRRSC